MCRLIRLILLIAISTSSIAAAQDPPLRPDTLLNWLRIIDIPNTRLLYAADTNGYYFAVKVDADRDILFCDYEHATGNRASPRSFSLEVLDTKGQSLNDIDAKKKPPDMVTIEYKSESSLGPVTARSSVRIAYSRGTFVALRKHDVPAVVVKYVETTGGDRRVLLSQRVQLPPTQTRTRR